MTFSMERLRLETLVMAIANSFPRWFAGRGLSLQDTANANRNAVRRAQGRGLVEVLE